MFPCHRSIEAGFKVQIYNCHSDQTEHQRVSLTVSLMLLQFYREWRASAFIFQPVFSSLFIGDLRNKKNPHRRSYKNSFLLQKIP